MLFTMSYLPNLTINTVKKNTFCFGAKTEIDLSPQATVFGIDNKFKLLDCSRR